MLNGKMLRSKKRVFLQALLLTILVFLIGVLIGILFEERRVDVVQEYYTESEINMLDIYALNNLISLEVSDCDSLWNASRNFADKIYEEARLLEMYEDRDKISDDMKVLHWKYDILRTLLWQNVIETKRICGEKVSSVIYLYNYDPHDLTEKAKQNVWAKILIDLKYEKGEEVILIPIAVNSNLISLNSLIDSYNIDSYPVLIINEKYLVTEISSVEDLEEYI